MEIEHHYTDQHLMACLFGTGVAENIVKSLPNGDLTDELEEILKTQFEILETFMKGKHFGTKSLEEYIHHLDELNKQLKEMRGCR